MNIRNSEILQANLDKKWRKRCPEGPSIAVLAWSRTKRTSYPSAANWNWYKENTITRIVLARLSTDEHPGNREIAIGTLWREEKSECVERWRQPVGRLQADGESATPS